MDVHAPTRQRRTCRIAAMKCPTKEHTRPDAKKRQVFASIGNVPRVESSNASIPTTTTVKDSTPKAKRLGCALPTEKHKAKNALESPQPMEIDMSEPDAMPGNVINIDEGSRDPCLYNEYAADVYRHLNRLEDEHPISAHFLTKQNVTSKHRAILVDWLHEVHIILKLSLDTFYRTVSIVDMFLQARCVTKESLQLVGVASMFIAAKYEDSYYPPVSDFLYLTNNCYNKDSLITMEQKILKALNFFVGRPLSLTFLKRYSRAFAFDKFALTLALFFLEVSTHSYKLANVKPSLLAASAAVLAARCLKETSWNATTRYYTGYEEKEVQAMAKMLGEVVVRLYQSNLQSVIRKYSRSFHLIYATADIVERLKRVIRGQQ